MADEAFIEEILGSKTKIRVLSALYGDESKTYYEKELADFCGASVSEVNRQIGTLIEFGLVAYTRSGRKKMYCLNRAHFLYFPLKGIFTLA
ncbi:MAG: helix-turn-helix domain-containing protein [bacterium]